MDGDLAWCIVCSKRTNDHGSPYCTEECRMADLTSQTPESVRVVPLTSPLPPAFTAPLESSHKARHSVTSRPTLDMVQKPAFSSSSSRAGPVPRDRRAFSFPATHAEPLFATSMTKRDVRSSAALPPFTRKPANRPSISSTNALPIASGSKHMSLALPTGQKMSKSTGGANTPAALDSVFCSTSESDNETKRKLGTGSKLRNGQSTVRPIRAPRPTLPQQFTMSPSAAAGGKIETLKPESYFAARSRNSPHGKHAQSPVSMLLASSASSRSREDIITWAKAVDSRPGDGDEDFGQGAEHRGRSRTRREIVDSVVTPPKGDVIEEEENLGTTPKGRIGSALAGLTIGGFGMGPIVKALTSVTSTASATIPATPFKQLRPSISNGLGLQSVPAPAEISRVAVVASTAVPVSLSEDSPLMYFTGATPTLSTMSISEVADPATMSTTDNTDHDHDHDQEHVEIITDDQSQAPSSSYPRGRQPPRRLSTHLKQPQPQPQPQAPRQTVLPLRPIASTATAIWNLSNYLRSFSPFTLPVPGLGSRQTSYHSSNDSATPTPSAAQTPSLEFMPSSAKISPALDALVAKVSGTGTGAGTGTAPVAASRRESPAPSPANDMVRSLPMDIILPVGQQEYHDERNRERLVRDMMERMETRRSRSRARSRSRPRSRSHPRTRSRTRSVSRGRHARHWSYDADASEDDAEATTKPHANANENAFDLSRPSPRRGRSRQGKALGNDDGFAKGAFSPSPAPARSRGRERDRSQEHETSRGRGRRDRTITIRA